MDIFDIYKPLRNWVAQLDLQDALYVVWAHSQFLQVRGFQLPDDIEVNRLVMQAPQLRKACSEWELEFLAKELVINCAPTARGSKSIREWKSFANTINHLRAFEDRVFERVGPEADIQIEILRIAHRQFSWQVERPNKASIARYYRIFSDTLIDQICVERLGIPVRHIYALGLALIGHYSKEFSYNLPFSSSLENISDASCAAFLAFSSRHFDLLRTNLRSQQSYDERFIYSYNDLRAFPLIQMAYRGRHSLVCPIPTLLFWRITSGLYYELVFDERFANPFGAAFQKYVGEVIRRGTAGTTAKFYSEHVYGSVKSDRKLSADWIIADSNSAIFVECKAKRLTWSAKSALSDPTPFRRDCDELASAVVQLYRTILDYQKNQYEFLQYSKHREVFPVVCTLENWHLLGPRARKILDDLVKAKLVVAGLPKSLPDEMPFSIMPVAAMETTAQAIRIFGIRDLFRGKMLDAERREWAWDTYLHSVPGYSQPSGFLFDDALDEIAHGM